MRPIVVSGSVGVGGIGDALALATIAHQGQTYGDRPYIGHPIAVARLIAITYGVHEHLLIPALLHDVVEDSEIGLHEIENLFGRDVEQAVDAVTKRPGEAYADAIDRAAAHNVGCVVKLADNTHNLSTLPLGDRREARYLAARPVLIAALNTTNDDPWADLVTVKARARAQR